MASKQICVVTLNGFACVLDSFCHVIEALLENQVNCSDQTVSKISVAAVIPYVSSDVSFAYHLYFC